MARSKTLTPEMVDDIFELDVMSDVEKMTIIDKEAQVSVVAKNEKGETIMEKTAVKDVQLTEEWLARVSDISLSVKVTPKIRDTFVSVEKAMTININTMDAETVQDIWESLQDTVIADTLDTVVKVADLMAKKAGV